MKTIKRNKILLFVFVTALVLSLGLATIFASAFNKNAMAATTAVGTITFEEDAQIRATEDADDTGIRFIANLDSELSQALFTFESDVATGFKTDCSLGMIIVPKQALAGVSGDYLTKIQSKYGRTEAQIAVNFTFDDGNIIATGDAENPYKIKGAIVGINVANLKYEYAAVVYYSTDGGATRVYSEKSCDAKFATLANAVLSDPNNEMTDAVKNSVVGYVAKSVAMDLGFDPEDIALDNNTTTISADRFFAYNESVTIANLFSYGVEGAPVVDSLVGVTEDAGVISASGNFGKAVASAEAYGGALNYEYNVYFYPETEIDLATGALGSNYDPFETIVIAGKEFEINDNNAISFATSGENDARDLASDKPQVVTLVDENSVEYKAKITIWSLLVTQENFLTMYDYQYNAKGNKSDLLYGYYKLTEDVDFSTYTKAVELGGFDCTEVGGTTKEETDQQTLYHGFAGVFEGNNKTINYSMGSGVAPVPVFFVITGGTVKNLTIVKTTGKWVSPLVATYANGATFENITAKCLKNTGSFGERSGLLVQSLWGSNAVTFKDINLELGAETSWSMFNTPILANAANNQNYTVSMRFTGKVVIDGLDVFFSKDSYGPFHYTNTTTGDFADYYCKLVNGTAYTNYHTEKDGDTTVYYADAVPAIEVVEGLNTVKIHKSKDATLTAENDASGFPYTPSVVYKTMNIEQDETFTYASALSAGKTLKFAYSVAIAEDTEYAVATSTVHGDVKTITRLVDAGNKALTSFECTTAGTYNFIVTSTDYEVVFVKVVVVAPAEVYYTTEVARDLKDGIDVAGLLEEAGFDADTTVATATLGDTTLSITDGVVSFGEVASMADAVKVLASENAQTLTLIGAENKYIFSNFKLYSILITTGAEWDEAYLYQTSQGYKVGGVDKQYYAVIGFDNESVIEILPDSRYMLGDTVSDFYNPFTGVIDGRGKSIIFNNAIDKKNADGSYVMNGTKKVQTCYGFASSWGNATLKNINIETKNFRTVGVLGQYVMGGRIENVNITSNVSAFSEGGFLWNKLAKTNDLIIKNVTIIATTTSAANANFKYRGLGALYNNSSAYYFTGKIIVDNLNIVSKTASVKKFKLMDIMYTSKPEELYVMGNRIELAQDATSGITYYPTLTDYNNKTNGNVITTVVEDTPIELAVNEQLAISSIVPQDKTFGYFDGNGFTKVSGTNQYTSDYILKYAKAGSYTLVLLTTDYEYHVFTVTVA